MRRLIASFALLLGIAAAIFAVSGCGKLKGALKPDAPPTTRLFVSGPLDTVNHVVHLYWFGTDADGRVVGFEVRLINPADTVAADSAWRYTTRSDSVVTVFTPAGYTAPVFEVRAIDNAGNKDPNPARQVFQFRNVPPVVKLTLKPSATDTTFASVTVGWTLNDPDGDPNKVVYRLWMDGASPDSFEVTTAKTFTMPTHRFLSAGSFGATRNRTLYVQGIDDGGMAGPIDSVTWIVKRPTPGNRARLLIIDDVPTSNAANNVIDSVYANTAARNLDPTTYTVFKVDRNPNTFKSSLDLAQTCKLFETVIYYRANETTLSTTLLNYGDGFGPYLEQGGKLYMDGLYLFSGNNASGGLDESFARTYLDCDGFIQAFVNTQNFADSSIGWGNPNGSTFRSTMFADSLKQQQLSARSAEAGGFRVFNVRRASEVAFEAAPGALTPTNTIPLPVGVSVPQPSGGRAIVLTVPLGTAIPRNGSGNFRVLAKIFGQLGLLDP